MFDSNLECPDIKTSNQLNAYTYFYISSFFCSFRFFLSNVVFLQESLEEAKIYLEDIENNRSYDGTFDSELFNKLKVRYN